MRNLIQKNVIGLFALVLAVATMSFKMIEKESVSSQWYNVDTDGFTITSSTPITEPSDPGCDDENQATVCAVEITLNPSNPFPANLNEAQSNHTRGQMKKRPN